MNKTKIKIAGAWFLAAACYFIIYGYNLRFPGEMYFDEIYFVNTARELIYLIGYTESVQPPFGTMLIALSIRIFGDNPLAWRLVSLVAGFGCLVLLYEITRILTKNPRIAFLAALLFSLDCMSFTQARMAILNAPMYFLMLLSVWCMIRHVVARKWGRKLAFFLSAIPFGLSIGTRLVGFSIIGVLLIFYWRLWQENKKKGPLIADTFIFFILPAVLSYESTYLIVPFIRGFNWHTIWEMQVKILRFHLFLETTHTYGSQWWTWPLMTRPIWYYFKPVEISKITGILCIGNPLIFWLIPAVMTWMVVQLFRVRTWIYQFIVIGFFTQWLQWAPVTRIKFFHYFYTAVPFAAIALAVILDKLWQSGKWGKVAAAVYLVLVAAMFIYWYPLLNGMLVYRSYYRQHMWFKSWI